MWSGERVRTPVWSTLFQRRSCDGGRGGCLQLGLMEWYPFVWHDQVQYIRSHGDIPSWNADDKPCLHIVHVKKNKTVYNTVLVPHTNLLQSLLQTQNYSVIVSPRRGYNFTERLYVNLRIWLKMIVHDVLGTLCWEAPCSLWSQTCIPWRYSP